MSGNGIEFPELPMTQEWQEGGSYRAGTQRAGGAAGWCSGGMARGSRHVCEGGRTWWFRGRSVSAYSQTPPRMGAARQAYTTPHTLSEDATRNHGHVLYQINRESPSTKMVWRSGNVAV